MKQLCSRFHVTQFKIECNQLGNTAPDLQQARAAVATREHPLQVQFISSKYQTNYAFRCYSVTVEK